MIVQVLVSPAAGPLAGHGPAGYLDVSAVLHLHELCCRFSRPIPVAAGSLKPSNPKMKHGPLAMVMFFFLFPLTQVPTLLPLGIEAALRFLGYGAGVPICLLLSLAELAIVVLVYYFSLTLLGDLLQARERRILEVVTKSGT